MAHGAEHVQPDRHLDPVRHGVAYGLHGVGALERLGAREHPRVEGARLLREGLEVAPAARRQVSLWSLARGGKASRFRMSTAARKSRVGSAGLLAQDVAQIDRERLHAVHGEPCDRRAGQGVGRRVRPHCQEGRLAAECMVSRGMTPEMVAPLSKPTKKPAM